jgi:uncharacterized phage-associated protein
VPSVIDVANYILGISRETPEDEEYDLISHMKLQKLVYFCQGFFLALYGRPLFSEPIEAWQHGPVCPTLYHLLKNYGALPITPIIEPEKIQLEEQEKYVINMVYDYYGQYSASYLRKMTHREGPWSVYEGGQIPQDAMNQYFNSLVEIVPEKITHSTEQEKKELLDILKKAASDSEIDLSQFSVSMGT